MKTATVTWITDNNYGTLLQAYALQQQLLQSGNTNVILSDRAALQEINGQHRKLSPEQPENCQRRLSTGRRLMRLVLHPKYARQAIINRIRYAKQESSYGISQQACDRFRAEKLSIRNITDLRTLKDQSAEFDAVFCGSDQIWSVLAHRWHPYYFLNFVYKNKFAYAPSLGTDKIPTEQLDEISRMVADFDALSVREQISAEQLAHATGKKVEWVADPTLLHGQEFWHNFAEKLNMCHGKYLLCYFLKEDDNEWYFRYAQELSRRMHVKIVLIPSRIQFSGLKYALHKAVGPCEFVSLFEHASYILTDSYHGAIFSLIFQKQFEYLMRFPKEDSQSQNIRVDSLFSYLEISDRMISEKEIDKQKKALDYHDISKKLNDFQIHSRKYLESCLEKAQQEKEHD